MATSSLPTPAYQFATRQLHKGEFISVRSCLFDYIDTEPSIWQNEDHSKEEILRAVVNFKKSLICL